MHLNRGTVLEESWELIQRGVTMFDALRQDVRHGVRMLVKAPGFTAIAVLSMAIGVGANAAMFSIADGLVLRPLPVPDAGGLMRVRATTATGVVSSVSYPDFTDLRERARSFDALAASRPIVAGIAREPGEPPQSRVGLAVTTGFFDTIRVQPAAGRGFTANEDRSDSRAPAVVLSHDLWTQQFGADPAIVGRHIRLATAHFTVVGVMPERFTGIDFYLPAAFYVPVSLLPSLDDPTQPNALERRDIRSFRVVGRLKPGVTLAQANQDVQQIGRDVERLHPDVRAHQGLLLRSDTQARFDDFFPVLTLGLMLIGLAVAVLCVACANVTGLLMSRAPERARELALRIAIGGSRERLVRQLITEAALLAMAGGGAGLALGYAGIRSFRQFQVASDAGVTLTYALDRRALAVALVAAIASALLSSLVPAWRSTRTGDLSSILRQSVMPSSRGRRLWGRHGLVAVQVGLTLVLLTVSVTFYRAFAAEYGRGPGFNTDHVLLASLDPALARYDQQRTDAFYRQLEDRLAAIPGVRAVGQT
jgi:macrolide transport system ATP-binding/permease protein